MTQAKLTPMTWTEADEWRASQNFTEEAVQEAFDMDAWWEHFDAIAISEEDIETLVTAAIVDHIKLASGVERLWELPENIQRWVPGPSSQLSIRRFNAVSRIIESMREHIQQANDEQSSDSTKSEG